MTKGRQLRNWDPVNTILQGLFSQTCYLDDTGEVNINENARSGTGPKSSVNNICNVLMSKS